VPSPLADRHFTNDRSGHWRAVERRLPPPLLRGVSFRTWLARPPPPPSRAGIRTENTADKKPRACSVMGPVASRLRKNHGNVGSPAPPTGLKSANHTAQVHVGVTRGTHVRTRPRNCSCGPTTPCNSVPCTRRTRRRGHPVELLNAAPRRHISQQERVELGAALTRAEYLALAAPAGQRRVRPCSA